MKSTERIVKAWEQGIATGDTAYRDGVTDVQDSPMEASAAAGEKYLRGVQEAERSGRRAARLRAVTLESWKQACRTYGVDRWRTSEKKGRDKLTRYYQLNRTALQALEDQIKAMPNVTEQDAEARALAWIRGMRAIRQGRTF